MRTETIKLFHTLMKKGMIDRTENSIEWEYWQDADVKAELEQFQIELGFYLYSVQSRVYLVPTQDNDLFLKNNVDYRKDMNASNDVRTIDLYLLNYLAVYIIYLMFCGESSTAQSREFIKKDAIISEFNTHCSQITTDRIKTEDEQTDYSENFIQLANLWLGKIEGSPDSKKIDEKYGCLNKLLIKFKADKLFEIRSYDEIYPTRKMRDLMPYFLRRERIKEIQSWLNKQN